MKKVLNILLLFAAGVAYSQEKDYYLGHHAISLEYAPSLLVGLQINYHYILNPKDRVMWMPKVSVGYSPFESSPYFDWGLDMAYGGKNRLVLGLGGVYIKPLNYKLITGDIRYLNYGKKHLFYFLTFRINYDYMCDCDKISPIAPEFRAAIGWKF